VELTVSYWEGTVSTVVGLTAGTTVEFSVSASVVGLRSESRQEPLMVLQSVLQLEQLLEPQ
jgi:hypothetical protein